MEDQQNRCCSIFIANWSFELGERLSCGNEQAQLEEFAEFIKTPGAVDDFLAKHKSSYQQEPMLQKNVKLQVCQLMIRLKEMNPATKWLEVNRPQIVTLWLRLWLT